MPGNPVQRFCNQNITVKHQVLREDGTQKTDGYGQPLYLDAEEQPARFVEEQNVVKNQQGMEVLSSAHVLTVEALALGDLVNGQAVQARKSLVSAEGEVLGWRSYL